MNRGSSYKQEFAEGAQFFYDSVNNLSRLLGVAATESAPFVSLSEAGVGEDPAVGPGRSTAESGFMARVSMSPDNRHLRLV
jgi:hypothetical protein